MTVAHLVATYHKTVEAAAIAAVVVLEWQFLWISTSSFHDCSADAVAVGAAVVQATVAILVAVVMAAT